MPFYFDEFKGLEHLTVTLFMKDRSKSDDEFIRLDGFLQNDIDIRISNRWGTVGDYQERTERAFNSGNLSSARDEIKGWIKHVSGMLGRTDNRLNRWANTQSINYTDHAKSFTGTDVVLPMTISIPFITDEYGKDIKKEVRDILYYIAGGFYLEDKVINNLNVFSSLFGMISPPGGYLYDPKTINADGSTKLEGTVSLVVPNLRIDNLLVSGVTITASKYTIAPQEEVVPNTRGMNMIEASQTKKDGDPLSITLELELEPAVYFSANDVHRMLGGDGQLLEVDPVDLHESRPSSEVDHSTLVVDSNSTESKYNHGYVRSNPKLDKDIRDSIEEDSTGLL